MPIKIWYNGAMHNMTALKMVTFVGGVKKYLTKGVTFINGEKKILWQTGNFSLDSWTLTQLQYPNQNGLPVGLYCNDSRINYNVGEYVARSNVSNISSPTNENCVKNGKIRTWVYPYYTGTNETYIGDVKSYDTYKINTNAGVMTITAELTTANKIDLNTNDLSVVTSNSISDNRNNNFLLNGVYCYDSTYAWVVVRAIKGSASSGILGSGSGLPPKYYVYTNSTNKIAEISCAGYNVSDKAYLPIIAIQPNGYLLITSVYQATNGGTITYGLKRINLANGTITDIESGLAYEVNSVLVDDDKIIYSYGNKVVKCDDDGSNKITYTGANNPLVLVGKIGNYYYAGSSRGVTGEDAKYLTIDILNASDLSLRESRDTDSKATIINALPYISNNEYLCFGTYHSISYNSPTSPTLQTNYRTLPTGTVSDVEYKIARIHGY